MRDSIELARRNVLCYFRDRAAVVFSLMGVLVVIMLYLLFLRNMLVESYPDMDGMGSLIDAWVLAGILGIVSVTTSAGSLQTMIEDRTSGKSKDILVTPMRSSHIAAGYILSTFAVGMIMSVITFVLSIIYLVLTGCPMSPAGVVLSVAMLIPSVLSGSIIVYAITSFFRSTAAFSGFFTIVSVLIGFLAGIYMPMGTMPAAMQAVGTLVPASHMAALFRQYLGSDVLNDVFAGAPQETLDSFRGEMGFDLSLGGFDFTPETSMIYVLGVSALFFVIAVIGIRKGSR